MYVTHGYHLAEFMDIIAVGNMKGEMSLSTNIHKRISLDV